MPLQTRSRSYQFYIAVIGACRQLTYSSCELLGLLDHPRLSLTRLELSARHLLPVTTGRVADYSSCYSIATIIATHACRDSLLEVTPSTKRIVHTKRVQFRQRFVEHDQMHIDPRNAALKYCIVDLYVWYKRYVGLSFPSQHNKPVETAHRL